MRLPNPRLQRTRFAPLRTPLKRIPLGSASSSQRPGTDKRKATENRQQEKTIMTETGGARMNPFGGCSSPAKSSFRS